MGLQIQVIINPAAGQAMPILHTLNRIFRGYGHDWDVAITKQKGDGRRLAEAAVAAGVDIVAAYGGDGTVAEVAAGLAGSDVPLAILPGGTANVMSVELGIPNDLAGACELFCTDNYHARPVDMGRLGTHSFLLRAGVGFEAEMVRAADREAKEGMGVLAYLLSALGNLRDPVEAQYRLILDGKPVESRGLTCLIANSANLGRPSLALTRNVAIDDGWLDIIVVRQADLRALLRFTADLAGLAVDEPASVSSDPQKIEQEVEKPLQHWQAKKIEIDTQPVQPVQVDGEMVGQTPLHCRIMPQAVRILVPALASV